MFECLGPADVAQHEIDYVSEAEQAELFAIVESTKKDIVLPNR